ncbi:MAG: AMP-binding protein [Candidatus Aenigmarchaeota archaeon]|nr:AMP-binding protein [Candidatus Aenigmarchaeota archaeon]
MPKLGWEPSRDFLENSNAARFMKAHGIKTYRELVEKSTRDIEWFWDSVVKFLGIEFYEPYSKVLDASEGIEWATWFSGGKVNIAHNCVDKHALGKNRAKSAIVWEGEDGRTVSWDYKRLYEESNAIANALVSLGAKRGDSIGIYMPMVPEAVASVIACMKIGAIYVPIFSGYGEEAIAVRLQNCDAKFLLTCDGFHRKGQRIEMKKIADKALKSCPLVKKTIVFRNIVGAEMSSRDAYFHDFPRKTDFKTLHTDAEDPFMVIYTSGTTGKPKGAVHVHGGFLVKIAQEVAFQTDLRDNDVLYWITDMGWIMAPWEIVGVLALGGTLFIYDGAIDYPDIDRLWKIIERHRISILGLSPTAVRYMMKFGHEKLKKHNLSSLRVLASTGEPWNPDPWEWAVKNIGGGRCPIINLSGGTEVGACFLSVIPIIPLKPCTLGGPSLGMDIDVYDDNGKPVRGAIGELVCRKPWPGMTRGVWKDPERYIEAYWSRFPGVWVHGDLASIDEDGMWFLHGRSDDTIKIAGKRVGPAEIESILVSHASVAESVAIGVPDELKGEALVCFVVLKTQYSEKLRDELKELVSEKLGKVMKPKEIKFVKMIPKTRNAKIMRRLVKKKYLGQPLGDLSGLENPEAVEEIGRAV